MSKPRIHKIKDHNACKAMCCFFCLRKEQGQSRPLTEREKGLIKEHFFKNFEDFELFLPGASCGSCRRKISLKFGNNPQNRPTDFPCDSDPNMYQNVVETISELRRGVGESTNCTCFYCVDGKKVFFQDKKTPGIPKPVFSNETSRDNRSLDQSRIDEVTEMLSKCTPKTKSGLIHAGIKELQAQKSSNSPVKVTSVTGGAPMTIMTGAKSKKKLDMGVKETITKETMQSIQNTTDLPNKTIKLITSEIRKHHGKRSVAPGIAEGLINDPKVLEKYFQTEYIPLQCKNENTKEVETIVKELVFCKDIPGFIDFIKESRGIKDEGASVKFGIDGGQNFFKVTVNVIVPPKKKTKTNKIKSRYKDGGVKKLEIIAIVEGVIENYENVKAILNLVKLQKIDFVIATDLKLCNILLGLSAHGCKHRCPYCTVAYGDFNKKNRKKSESDLRTLGDIRKWARELHEYCQNMYPDNPEEGLKLHAKDFYNCIHEPLFDLPDETLIMDILPLPELHLMLGCVNGLLTELNKKWSEKSNIENPVWKFCDREGIKKITYRGFALEGPQCKLLLSKLDKLIRQVPRSCKFFVKALQAFDSLRVSSFSEEVQSTFKEDFNRFTYCFDVLDWDSGSTKIHIILDHLDQFVKNHGALGPFNEQASEAVHNDWLRTWNSFKTDPHPEKLKEVF